VITGNNITGNDRRGICLVGSSNNTIAGNNIVGNSWDGIYLYESSGNTITGNKIENNRDGIDLYESSGNTITNNIVGNNWVGIYLSLSSNNLIYNNVFANDVNVVVEVGVNYWSIEKTRGTNIVGGPYLGGNYWSRLSEYCTDSDGDLICDQPYRIDKNNIDYYPLAKPEDFTTPTFTIPATTPTQQPTRTETATATSTPTPTQPPTEIATPTTTSSATYIIGALIAVVAAVLAVFALKKHRSPLNTHIFPATQPKHPSTQHSRSHRALV